MVSASFVDYSPKDSSSTTIIKRGRFAVSYVSRVMVCLDWQTTVNPCLWLQLSTCGRLGAKVPFSKLQNAKRLLSMLLMPHLAANGRALICAIIPYLAVCSVWSGVMSCGVARGTVARSVDTRHRRQLGCRAAAAAARTGRTGA